MDVYERFKKDLILVVTVSIIIQLCWSYLPIQRDNSDGNTRSGVSVHVDALTGCEYLGGMHGGLTPRLDINGLQICK